MPPLTLPSPAKLNLCLHILGQRADGYHELQTFFQLLDFGDELYIDSTNTGLITLDTHFPDVKPSNNLIVRAAKLLQSATNTTLGARIQIKKILPMGGGIGGGSSNAATTLVGLNHLWQTHLSLDELAALGHQLGADVPVFIRGRSAWAEGIGEKLTPIDTPTRWYVVLSPNCHVSTAEIFSHKDLTRDTLAITVAAFLEKGGKNDCQRLVETLFPQVRDAVEWLNQFGPARLTGTGACVFASFPSEQKARDVFTTRPTHINGFVAKSVNESPLHHSLPSQ